MTSPVETLKGGALNAAISNAVVGILRENVGKGPRQARTIHSDRVVLCVLEDNMTRAEQSLATHGKSDHVLGIRHAFQETMQEELTGAVEALTGRKVIAFMSTNHVDPDLAAEVFVLDEPVTTTEEVRAKSFDEQPVATSASRDGQRAAEHQAEVTPRRDASQAQVSQDAERWLDDGGSFSSVAVARSMLQDS
jgi:uncharacterized protein YbcI